MTRAAPSRDGPTPSSAAADSASSVPDWLTAFGTRYVERTTAAIQALDLAAIHAVADALGAARARGSTIFVAGNGGSAATATHWVNDLAKATRRAGARHVRAVSLTDSTSWLTALANDEGYERVFAGQLENLAGEGDVLAVISASGNSPNLVRAVEVARGHGMVTVGLLGFDGGALRTMVDHLIWVRSEVGAYGLVENVHTVVCDLLAACLANPESPYAGSAR